MQIDEEPSWIDLLISYFKEGMLSMDRKEARKIKYQSSRYLLHEEKLYKWSYSLPFLKCLQPSEADYGLRDVHEVVYRNHIDKIALAYKLLR